MSNFNSADIAAFKDVWVFCEQREGKLMPTDFELISKGRDLADELGVNLCGLLLGGEGIESAAKELGGYGADKVLVCESPLLAVYNTDAYAKVICDVIEDLKPEAFLIGATNIGRDLGPRCAARLHTGLSRPVCIPACARTAPTWTWMWRTTSSSCVSPAPWTWTARSGIWRTGT